MIHMLYDGPLMQSPARAIGIEDDPDEPFYGWLMAKHPDGQWVSIAKPPFLTTFTSRPAPTLEGVALADAFGKAIVAYNAKIYRNESSHGTHREDTELEWRALADAREKLIAALPPSLPAPVEPPWTGKNRYGVDMDYFRAEMKRLSYSLPDRPADELSRYLQALANTAADVFHGNPAPDSPTGAAPKAKFRHHTGIHQPTCPYDNRIAAKDNGFADCNCDEDYDPKLELGASTAPTPVDKSSIAALGDFVPELLNLAQGAGHDDADCPGDDTCRCENIRKLNAELRAVENLLDMPKKDFADMNQSWAEIRDTLSDNMLNTSQKRVFVISILRGQLANPPAPQSAPGADRLTVRDVEGFACLAALKLDMDTHLKFLQEYNRMKADPKVLEWLRGQTSANEAQGNPTPTTPKLCECPCGCKRPADGHKIPREGEDYPECDWCYNSMHRQGPQFKERDEAKGEG